MLLNSLWVATGTACAAGCLGFAAACACRCVAERYRPAWILAAVTCLALPPFLVVNTWIDRFGLTGPWQGWLPFPLYSRAGVILILSLLTWPITFLFVLGAWNSLSQALPDSDPCLRGRWFIRHVLIPGAKSAMAPAGILTAAVAFNQFSVPAILQVRVYPVELWIRFSTEFDYSQAVALSWPMLIMPLLALVLARRAVSRRGERAPGNPISADRFRHHLGRGWTAAVLFIMSALWILSVGFPAWQLAESGRTWSEFPAAVAAGKTALIYSCVYASATALLVVTVGIALARFRAGHALWLLFLFPGIGLGIAALYLLNRPQPSWMEVVYPSIGLGIGVLTLRYAAIGHFGAYRARLSLDPTLAESARMDGANRWQVFRHTLVPKALPTWVATGYVTYVLCLWDVETLLMIEPPGTQTLAMRVFNLLHYGHNHQVDALCIALVGLAVAPLALWTAARLIRRLLPALRITRILPGAPAIMITAGLFISSIGCSPRDPTVTPASRTMSRSIDSSLFLTVQVIGDRGNGTGQFQKPRSLAIDHHDNLYVSDMTGRIQKFDPAGQFVTSWQMPETDRGRPKGMACDQLNRVIVVEPHYARVNHFTSDGTLAFQWGHYGTNRADLVFPRAVAVTGDGEIYLSEFGVREHIQHFSADGSVWIGAWGTPGIGEGEFNRAEGLTFHEGKVFVADSCNHRIQVFSAEGRFLRAYGSAGTDPGLLSYPYDIRIDESGRQYVCEFGNSRIQIFDRDDALIEVLGGPGSDPGQFHNPWSLALDRRGNLYVADSKNHRVQKFTRRDPLRLNPKARRSASTNPRQETEGRPDRTKTP